MDIVKVIDSEEDDKLNENFIYTNGYVTEGYFMGGRKHQKITIILKRKLESNFDDHEIEKKYKDATQDILSAIEKRPDMSGEEISQLEDSLSEYN